MKRKNVEKDKKATKKKLKKEWVNNMVGEKKHSKNCQNLKKNNMGDAEFISKVNIENLMKKI